MQYDQEHNDLVSNPVTYTKPETLVKRENPAGRWIVNDPARWFQLALHVSQYLAQRALNPVPYPGFPLAERSH